MAECCLRSRALTATIPADSRFTARWPRKPGSSRENSATAGLEHMDGTTVLGQVLTNAIALANALLPGLRLSRTYLAGVPVLL